MYAWYVSFPAGVAACVVYFLMRYQRPKPGLGMPWTLWEYIRFDLGSLLRGAGMYTVIYVAWGIIPEVSRFGISFVENLPAMNVPLAVALGFAAKKIWDYTLKKFAKIG